MRSGLLTVIAVAALVGLQPSSNGQDTAGVEAKVGAYLERNAALLERWNEPKDSRKWLEPETRAELKVKLADAVGIALEDPDRPEIRVRLRFEQEVDAVVYDIHGFELAHITRSKDKKVAVAVSRSVRSPMSAIIPELEADAIRNLQAGWKNELEKAAVGPRRVKALRDEVNKFGNPKTVRGLMESLTRQTRVLFYDEAAGNEPQPSYDYGSDMVGRLGHWGFTHLVIGVHAKNEKALPVLLAAMHTKDERAIMDAMQKVVGWGPTLHAYYRVFEAAFDAKMTVVPVAVGADDADTHSHLQRIVGRMVEANPNNRVMVWCDGKYSGRLLANRDREDPTSADLLRQRFGKNAVVSIKCLTEKNPHAVLKLVTGWTSPGQTRPCLIPIARTEEIRTLPVYANEAEQLESWDHVLLLPGWDWNSLPDRLRR